MADTNADYIIKTLRLSKMIKEHFGLDIDLPHLEVRVHSGTWEYFSKDNSNGFVLVKPDGHVRDYKRKMESLRDLYLSASDEKRICREFVDYDNRIAGFSWRIKEDKDG